MVVPLGRASASAAAPIETDEPEHNTAASAGSGPTRSHQAGALTDQPSPEPLLSAEHLIYVLRYERGQICIASVSRFRLAHAQPVPHKLGRYALEFWAGQSILERVSFDFPLLSGRKGEAQPWAAGLTAERQVQVPWVDHANRLLLVDRTKEQVQDLPWPPSDADERSAKDATGEPPSYQVGHCDRASGATNSPS